eukprot:NODE_1342_length_2510_cov_11.750315.p1 GENE.NODE_1342_length_2510_cov_11.750315~~NODE_1342_length_2510_cov_11.750315.p1  ORF type:complete len:710 (+),score=157.58 NODE_1342_length_2510_cov_11.750315:163-2292(+)
MKHLRHTIIALVHTPATPGRSTLCGTNGGGVDTAVAAVAATFASNGAVAGDAGTAPAICSRAEAHWRGEEHARKAAKDVRDTLADIEPAMPPMPRLRSLNVGGNAGSNAGVARVEEALLTNTYLERLTLDHMPHNLKWGVRSLVTVLPLNTALRSLSLCQCSLGDNGVVAIAKAAALNASLESLSLRDNPFDEEGAIALGLLLRTASSALRSLNAASCGLRDESGAALAAGLAGSASLESLNLHNNLFHDATGRAFVDALNKQFVTTTLNLELNIIDCRHLNQIKTMLARNVRVLASSKPQAYRKRITELKRCAQEVQVLSNTLHKNAGIKRRISLMQIVHAGVLEAKAHGRDTGEGKPNCLEDVPEKLRLETEAVDKEFEKYRALLQSETHELNIRTLEYKIAKVETQISAKQAHTSFIQGQVEVFNRRAEKEVADATQELQKAESDVRFATHLHTIAFENISAFRRKMVENQKPPIRRRARRGKPKPKPAPPSPKVDPNAVAAVLKETTRQEVAACGEDADALGGLVLKILLPKPARPHSTAGARAGNAVVRHMPSPPVLPKHRKPRPQSSTPCASRLPQVTPPTPLRAVGNEVLSHVCVILGDHMPLYWAAVRPCVVNAFAHDGAVAPVGAAVSQSAPPSGCDTGASVGLLSCARAVPSTLYAAARVKRRALFGRAAYRTLFVRARVRVFLNRAGRHTRLVRYDCD